MRNSKIWLGMLVMVLAFGMTVVGCGDGAGGGGTQIPEQFRGEWVAISGTGTLTITTTTVQASGGVVHTVTRVDPDGTELFLMFGNFEVGFEVVGGVLETWPSEGGAHDIPFGRWQRQ